MNKLEQAAADYEENGYAIIRDVLPVDLVAEVDSHVKWLMAKYPDLRPEHFHHPLIRHDAFWVRLISDPRLVDIAEYFLGSDLASFTAHYICKPPLDGQPVLWHQDGAYWKLDPMEALTVWVAIDPSTTENGCLRMVPGSHRLPLHEPTLRTDQPNMLFSMADQDIVNEWSAERGIVDIELSPGDVSIHHPNLLHCSGPNTSNVRRCGLDLGYISTSTRISSDNLYLDPILVRGRPVKDVNFYRAYPEYNEGETIPFSGKETWNERVALSNKDVPLRPVSLDDEAPIDTTLRMISRLKEGTVRR
ncbi:phytanoyl-CoA dioxygenase family protein [Amycolatopsis keratiniphila]|uniref:Phytanoyl-CoA dioxygenase n=1 Tax=Amycolatopsis keratiniphila subsp. keratiniphila TaxID=227715 RepID=A0A1W2LT93_9PSEU|nr:phytanoyl-CoA dioxygenase family protein [Amycolatopsis keratiniphila]ONF67863.1 phytanoyl-CoA dioxygenase [Amycolatopsis keratiniphila subsp. keratiniphila]